MSDTDQQHDNNAEGRSSGLVNIVDKATLFVAIGEPLITVPQAWSIFSKHTAADISLLTWIGYDVLTLVWLTYGWLHKRKRMLIYQGLSLVVQTVLIIGAIMYGAKW